MATRTRPRPRRDLPRGLAPWEVFAAGTDLSDDDAPDIIEFVTSDKYLNRPNLYPRQATLLKMMFLETELFCADEQTEILTRRGWKHFDEVSEGEDVLALNPDRQVAEWVSAERINVFPVDGASLISMEASGHSSLTTLDHRWPVERYEQGGGQPRWEQQWRTTAEICGRDRILCAAPVANLPVSEVYLDEFVELVGWYWTEGHLRTGHRGVTITQSAEVNPEHVATIEALLTKLYGSPLPHLRWDDSPAWSRSDSRGMAVFRLNEAASRELILAAPGVEKVVDSSFLTALSLRQIYLFIDTSIAADGWIKNGCRAISQAVCERLDAMQMACSLAGIRTSLREVRVGGTGRYAGRTKYQLSLLERRSYKSFQRVERREVEHTGVVWCPTTRFGTWLARRSGHVYFTGNTDYDYEVIGEWSENYAKTANDKGEGTNGTQVDVLDRIKINRTCPCGHDRGHHTGIFKGCLAYDSDAGGHCECDGYRGRNWFRENVIVVGRRGSKGHIGGLAGGAVLWHYLCKGDPQGFYGVDRDKRLSMIVFAGKKEQALANQWRDLNNIVLGAPCFSPYISRAQTQSLTLFSRQDFVRMFEREARGVYSEVDPATFEIIPRESTMMSGRGPAAFSQYYDEMAHIVKGVAKAEASVVYDSATPALDQFGNDAFLYEGSSPWTQTGQFYENYLKAIEVEEDGQPVYPEILMVQLTSWDIYKDWEKAHYLQMWPDGMRFPRFRQAIQSYDHGMKQLERANPETFAVERRSLWAASLNTYLNADKIAEIWKPWPTEDRPMMFQERGRLDITYRAHGDPSKSGARFGYAIAHLEGPDERGFHHVVFDVIHDWDPADNPDHQQDYDKIEEDLKDFLDRFRPSEQTFDQYPMGSTLAHLRQHVRDKSYPKRVDIYERTATNALNWKTYEAFKTALGLGLVHGPYHELAEAELTYLEDKGGKVEHPTAGPVQTKDVADCLAIVTFELIGHEIEAFTNDALGNLPVRGGNQSGSEPFGNQQDPIHSALSSFGRSRGGRP